MFLKIAYKSLVDRKTSVVMTLLALIVSISVLISVEHIRVQTKESFASTVSGADLIIGARTGSLNLLLYSVFRVGAPTNNISWSTYKDISASDEIKWSIPLSLGDSHKGYRVLGTNQDYFRYFSYGAKHPLIFADGREFSDAFEVVLGAAVARELGYSPGSEILLSHGISSADFNLHKGSPFTVTGVLEPTGTPVDQTVHVSLQGLKAIHNSAQYTGDPESITAFMVALKSRIGVFSLQRTVNNYKAEPVMAILPGVALSELWQMMGILEQTLRFIGVLVLLSALLGLSAMLLSSVRERRHEIQLLRMAGASPFYLFLLSELEVLLITLAGLCASLLFVWLAFALGQGYLAGAFGINISADIFTLNTLVLSLIVAGSALLTGALPALAMYIRALRP